MPKTNMFDPNTFSEVGGQSLAGIEGVVVASTFKHTNWAKKDGSIPTYKSGKDEGKPVRPSTVWAIQVKTDDLDSPIEGLISVSGVLRPSKDAVLVAKDLEGAFVCHPEGKEATFNKSSGAAIFIDSLANASFDFAAFNESGVEALVGYRIAFDEVQRKDAKGADLGKPTVVCSKIVHGPGTSAKAGAKKAAPAAAKVAAKVKPAPKVEEPEVEETEGEEVDAETLVTDAITEILSEESPLPKAKVSMKLNKKLAEMGLENADRLAALKLATSDEFLAAGPWSYDKKSLAAL